MFCHKCGEKIENDDKFCKKCGMIVGGKNNNYLKWLGYIWIFVVNIFAICVVLAIYSNLYDNFEIIVVTLLIFIYLSIQGFIMTYGKTIFLGALALDKEFHRVRNLLKEETTETELEDFTKTRKKFDSQMVKIYIKAFFMFVIYLIALLNLFTAL